MKKIKWVLVFVLITLIAIISYFFVYYISNNQSRFKMAELTSIKSKQDKKNSEYVGWQDYGFKEIGVTFKYPRILVQDLYNENLYKDAEGEYLSWSELSLDRPSAGFQDWVIRRADIEDLLVNPSCDLLKQRLAKTNNEFVLPDSFSEQNSLCGVVKKTDTVLFYVIGKDRGYESLPFLVSNILIFGKSKPVLIYGMLNSDVNKELDLWRDEYLKSHKNVDFPSDEFFSMYKLAEQKIDLEMQNPGAETLATFDIFKSIATSIGQE